jgi:hypothetical protein
MVSKTINDKARAILQKQSTKISGNKGYAEEVDIEVYNHQRQKEKECSNTVYEDDEDNDDEDYRILPTSSSALKDRSKYSKSMSHSQQGLQSSKPGEIFNRLSSNLKSGFSSSSIPQVSTSQSSSWNVRASKSSTRYSSSAENEENDNYEEYYRDQVTSEQDDDHIQQKHDDDDGGFDYDKMNELKSVQNPTKKDSLSPSISSLPMKFPASSKSSTTHLSSHQYMSDTLSKKDSSAGASDHARSSSSSSSSGPSSSSQSSSNRVEEVKPDGTKIIQYRNGTIKEVSPAGQSLVKFTNGDTKFTDPIEGKVVYFYEEAHTAHTTYTNGMELYEFPNGQVRNCCLMFTRDFLFFQIFFRMLD